MARLKIGLLWYDDDPRRDLDQKITDAVQRFVEKFGVTPDLCYVHPSTASQEVEEVGTVQLKTVPYVLPNHFLIGLSEN